MHNHNHYCGSFDGHKISLVADNCQLKNQNSYRMPMNILIESGRVCQPCFGKVPGNSYIQMIAVSN